MVVHHGKPLFVLGPSDESPCLLVSFSSGANEVCKVPDIHNYIYLLAVKAYHRKGWIACMAAPFLSKGQPAPPGSNGFLRSLSPHALSLLKPDLHFVSLPFQHVLRRGGEPPAFVYFLNEGLVSLVIHSATGKSAEVGVIGRESLAPAPLIDPHDPVTQLIQIAGNGYRIGIDVMRGILNQDPAIRELAARHSAVLGMQVEQIAGCNALHHAEQRLARWLLMVNDRVSTNPVPLTQEFLGLLLGVTRSTVSEIANALERKGAIALRRESIEIRSRTALEQCSCECYKVIAGLLFGLHPDPPR
jgi:CRP-like cAMP-binding protein